MLAASRANAHGSSGVVWVKRWPNTYTFGRGDFWLAEEGAFLPLLLSSGAAAGFGWVASVCGCSLGQALGLGDWSWGFPMVCGCCLGLIGGLGSWAG